MGAIENIARMFGAAILLGMSIAFFLISWFATQFIRDNMQKEDELSKWIVAIMLSAGIFLLSVGASITAYFILFY